MSQEAQKGQNILNFVKGAVCNIQKMLVNNVAVKSTAVSIL